MCRLFTNRGNLKQGSAVKKAMISKVVEWGRSKVRFRSHDNLIAFPAKGRMQGADRIKPLKMKSRKAQAGNGIYQKHMGAGNQQNIIRGNFSPPPPLGAG
ncbi:hypothetical protein ACFL5V_03700 [Fibrobacterota bacterium]